MHFSRIKWPQNFMAIYSWEMAKQVFKSSKKYLMTKLSISLSAQFLNGIFFQSRIVFTEYNNSNKLHEKPDYSCRTILLRILPYTGARY